MKKIDKRKVNKYFKMLNDAEEIHFNHVESIERVMKKETGIKDIEFFGRTGVLLGLGMFLKQWN